MGMSGFGGRMFDLADANHDGRVTLPEATDAALRHFDTADVNRDGQLTPDERARCRCISGCIERAPPRLSAASRAKQQGPVLAPGLFSCTVPRPQSRSP